MEHQRYCVTISYNEKSELLHIYDCNYVYANLWYSGIIDAMEAIGGAFSEMIVETVDQKQIIAEHKSENRL